MLIERSMIPIFGRVMLEIKESARMMTKKKFLRQVSSENLYLCSCVE